VFGVGIGTVDSVDDMIGTIWLAMIVELEIARSKGIVIVAKVVLRIIYLKTLTLYEQVDSTAMYR
jgi:hypothetical protein